jgi:hypothetical protein
MSIRKMIEEIFSGKLTESTDSFKRLISEKIQGKLKKSKKEMQMDCTKVAGAIRKKVLAKE